MKNDFETTIKPLALIVDDEPSICQSLAGVLTDEGWDALTANSGREGLQKFTRSAPDVVFLDVWMEGWDGIATLQKLRDLRTDIPIVIMSGHGTIETAVRATKLGAFDFIEKPLSLEKILPMLDHAQVLRRQRSERTQTGGSHVDLIGQAPGIDAVKKQIRLVAPRNAWVLITGENGTGKEVVAQSIHALSPRANKPFVAINCAAIPEELIESELFGHTKGAFTNAIGLKRGKFELAHQGTLFLDEIADMSLKTQAKILRILQEQQFERLGDSETIHVDVRVLAATNKDLQAAIAAGTFREDLFYRLNVIPFHLPPLRERGRDILLLAEHFLKIFSSQVGGTAHSFTDAAKDALLHYPWPGNIRELKNLVERLCIMAPGDQIDVADLPEAISGSDRSATGDGHLFTADSLKQAKTDFERMFILDKLKENQWNVSKTAEAIGIERSNLHRKLKVYDIDPKLLKG